MNRSVARTTRGLAILAATISLTCSDDGGGGDDNDTVVSGVAYLGGPIADAEVIVYQIATATGERTNERGRGRTSSMGTFEVNLGATFNSVEIDVIGGSYVDLATEATVQRGPAVLHGLALDLAIAEKRLDVAVTPWSHLVYALGESRAAIVPRDRLGSLKLARDLFAAHLGFDPTHTALADLARSSPSAPPEFKHAVTLAGLSTMAQIAQSDGFADVTAQRFVDVLDLDARSSEHLFDGNLDTLAVTSVCPPPPGCLARGPGCYNSCAVSSHALRAHLGNGVRAYLRTHTATGQTAATLATWLDDVRTNDEPRLFPSGLPEEFDSLGPRIAWVTPAADGVVVAGTIDIQVDADDPSGVASLTVAVEGPGARPIADTDPSPMRFVGTLDTTSLNDGALTLRATATDTDTNVYADPPRMIEVNNLLFGTASGTVVVTGPVAGAAVRVYRLDTGTPDMPGALLGQGITQSNGTFGNVQLADGYTGPVLIEAGGSGTYAESAAPPATPLVTLDVSDTLRTIVPDYVDGAALANIVVSPYTTFAVAHLSYLQATSQGATVAARWTLASAAMEAHFGVANIRTITPLPADQMVSLVAAARYGLGLIGLSQTALTASAPLGDAGTFPTTMNALRVVRVLASDIADGCWNGLAISTPLLYGGTQAVTEDSTRRGLANAIVDYLNSPRNQTPFGGAVDVLSLLDTLAMGGGNPLPGACMGVVTGHVFDDNGGVYDQVDPTITIVPGDGAVVGGIVPVMADADDLIDTRVTLIYLAPAGTIDLDGDPTDEDADANLDTRPLVPLEGPLMVSLYSRDDSMNDVTKTVTWQVDNAPPVVTIGGVADGAWYGAAVTPTATTMDTHPMSFLVTLNGAPFTSGTPVTTEGQYVLRATARDTVGNETIRTVTFYVDLADPTIALDSAPLPTWIRGPIMLRVIASDTMMMYGSLGMDVTVTATGPTGSVVIPTMAMPTTLGDGRRQLVVTIDTAAITAAVGDGALSVRFAITDRGGHSASLTEARTIDNTAPTVTLADIRNQSGAMINGYVSEATATITGIASIGGSPVTVTVTASPGGSGMVVPNVSGAFSFTTTTLPEGVINVTATAVDAAGNPSAGIASTPLTIDRTGPTITLAPSTALDESGCDVSIVVGSGGSITPSPVTYSCPMAMSRRLDIATAATAVGKFTNRMTTVEPSIDPATMMMLPGDNPLKWLPTADDGTGVGLAVVPSTIQFEIFLTSTFPLGVWRDSTNPTANSGDVSASLYATAAQFPELAAHTAAFSIIIRAQDRLGNVTATPTIITWSNHPLAPPVWVRYVGLADAADPTLGMFSLFKHSLTPSASQVGLATAMSSGGALAVAPRGLYEFEVWNPHPQPINVGFFLPAFGGATYTKQIRQVNPFINGTNGIVNNPANGFCGWNADTTSFRMTGGAAPFNCAAGTTCTCFNAASPEPIDDLTPATIAALGTAQLMIAAWDVNLASPARLTRQSLTPTVNGYPFYEFAIPARPSATIAGHARVLVALPNLDLWNPAIDPSIDIVQESDGVGSEVHFWESGATRFAPVMTAAFYERWADCRLSSLGTCSAMHARRRLRATTQANVSVPGMTIRPYVRSRATGATTSDPELIPDLQVADNALIASSAASWTNCETTGTWPCPTIPNIQFSPPF